MPDTLYQNPTLFAEGDNRITLSASEQLALKEALYEQIIEHKISGLSQELIYAVFHKTIRYNKREDDLNGVCLGNLTSTGSRSDYVNKHVTELIAQSVLISRLGTHGRILSINFNFAQWGKSVEYNRENGGLVCDPEALLATSAPLSDRPQSGSHAPRGNPVSNAPALRDTSTATEQELGRSASGLHSHEARGNEGLTDIFSRLLPDNIPLNIAALITEDVLKQVMQKLVDFIVPLLQDNAIIEHIKNAIKPQTEPDKIPKSNIVKPVEAFHETPKPEQAENAENDIPTTLTEESKDYSKLIFPKALKPYEQTQITRILEKEATHDLDTVQTVLDSMSSRYQAGLEPIKSPIAYFRKLLTSAQQGDFDRSYAEVYREQRAETQQQEKTQSGSQERRLHLDKYNEAKNKYEFLKLFSQNTGTSLRAEAKERKWIDLIEEMGFDLGEA